MKENDYYGHYKAFVKELSQNPERTLQLYCQENGVMWRRLYDWMRRNHISLKQLYQTYKVASGEDSHAAAINDAIEFRELIPTPTKALRSCHDREASVIRGVSVMMPSGVSVSIGECSAAVLSRLLEALTGKEVSDVLA